MFCLLLRWTSLSYMMKWIFWCGYQNIQNWSYRCCSLSTSLQTRNLESSSAVTGGDVQASRKNWNMVSAIPCAHMNARNAIKWWPLTAGLTGCRKKRIMKGPGAGSHPMMIGSGRWTYSHWETGCSFWAVPQ